MQQPTPRRCKQVGGKAPLGRSHPQINSAHPCNYKCNRCRIAVAPVPALNLRTTTNSSILLNNFPSQSTPPVSTIPRPLPASLHFSHPNFYNTNNQHLILSHYFFCPTLYIPFVLVAAPYSTAKHLHLQIYFVVFPPAHSSSSTMGESRYASLEASRKSPALCPHSN